ncbi:Uncharacterised protein [Shigella sonnei]|nr:Uncharacterised protein [Shigella sonnei]
MSIAAGVNFSHRTQDRVRTKYQIRTAGSVFHFAGFAVTAFKQLFRFVGRFPLVTHIQQVHEEVIAQYANAVSEDAVFAAIEVGTQYAHPAHQRGHFRRGQGQLLGFVDQQ